MAAGANRRNFITNYRPNIMNDMINLESRRAAEARLAHRFGPSVVKLMLVLGALLLGTGVVVLIIGGGVIGGFAASFGLLLLMPAVWHRRYLSVLPTSGQDLAGQLSSDVLARLKPGLELQPQALWQALSDHWQAGFFANRLLISSKTIEQQLSSNPADLHLVFAKAQQLAQNNQSGQIELGFVVAGLLTTSQPMQSLLQQLKFQPQDIDSLADWLGRNLAQMRTKKRSYGGIARDWAFGFTPLLNRFGTNITQAITNHGVDFTWLINSPAVTAMDAAFNNRAAAIALIGPEGIGKTTSAYALAQKLIEGDAGSSLAYHELVSISATDIASNARGEGSLEQIMIRLANEAMQAGHIVLFFDNAQMFLGGGPGTFDATQILVSIIEARSAPIILAITPEDYQRLKAQNQSLANLITPVIVQEMDEASVMHVLEDYSVNLEQQNQVFVSYEALHEAYRLSGRYEQEEAYPGKAVKLLKQAVPHSSDSVVTAASVQQAVEQTRGVKVGTAVAAEADTLLNLEAKIHERMINQVHAVKVVSNALRRARAGVANPKRPIGSFLFLGPTGVGKTELAKAIAATYFGNVANMVRLDMSEYQQPEDVNRLLSNGAQESGSLIMAVRSQPFSVVLLDEIEKAHPNVLNLLLQMFDEGQLTDTAGKAVSFKDCIIIVTSNAGAQTIRERVQQGQSLDSFQEEFTNELINSGQFKPELLNRFDEIVLFGPLKPEELGQVVALMITEINQTLANQNISVELTQAAINRIVEVGYDPRLGARPMRRTLQKAVEDTVAQKILRNEIQAGSHVVLDVPDLSI